MDVTDVTDVTWQARDEMREEVRLEAQRAARDEVATENIERRRKVAA